MSARGWDRAAPGIMGAVAAAPVLAVKYPPMTDLPLHEGMVALLAMWKDPTFVPPGVYELSLGHTNQLFYALAYPLALAFGSLLACKIIVAGTIVATVVAAGRLAEHLGVTPWASLLVVPAALGWAFFYGFVANLVGLAVFLAVLPVVDRFTRAPTPRGVVPVGGAMIVTHLAHETSLAALSVAIVVLAVGERLDRRWLLRLVPLTIGALLVFAELRSERGLLTASGRSLVARGVVFHAVWDKLQHVGALLFGTEEPVPLAAAVVTIGGCLGLTISDRNGSRVPPHPTVAARLADRRFELLAGALLLAYLALPYAVNFGAWLFARFLAPAYAIGVIALSRCVSRPSLVRRALYGSVALSWVLLLLPEFGRAEATNASLDEVLGGIEGPAAVAVLDLARRDQFNVYDTASAGARVLASRGGRMLHAFTEYPIAPVQVRAGCRWDESVARVGPDPLAYRPGFDSTRFRYVLVYGAPHDRRLVEAAFRPEAQLVVASGPWELFRSTLEVAALDAPDEGPPVPPPPTLAERMTQGR